MKTVQHALSEFPGEPELMELEKLVQKNQERAAQAVDLLNRAREGADKSQSGQTLEGLREASNLDSRNPVIRTVLVNTLLEQARKSMESDPDAAEAALAEILQLDPGHVPARSLASQMGDRKREEFVGWCLSQSRRLQTDGDIPGAQAIAAQGLASYPNEPRLQQLQAALQRAQDASPRTSPPTSKPAAPGPPPLAKPEAARAEAAKPPVVPPIGPPARPPQAPALPQLRMPPPPPGWTAGPPSLSSTSTTEIEGLVTKTLVAKAPEQTAPPKRGPRKPAMMGILSAAAVVLLLGGGFWYVRHKKVPPPTPDTTVKVKVNLHSAPAGAQIKVNGEVCGTSTCDLDLAPGDYKAEATLTDYTPAVANFTIAAGQSSAPEVALTLLPPPGLVTISTDVNEGTVTLDRDPPARLQGADFEIAKLAPGSHTIYLQSGPFSSKLSLEIADGQMPKIEKLETNAMHGLVIVHAGSIARMYSSVEGAKATLDGKPLDALKADGLELKDLAPGKHEVLLDSVAGPARASFDASSAPGVIAALLSQQNIGVLSVTANEDGAEIYLNGERTSRTTMRGQARLNLPPKTYVVRLQKDGFLTPPEQTAVIGKADVKSLDFKLTPARSTLNIHRGVPGSDVSVDGKSIGIVPANGEFSAAYVEPGSAHRLADASSLPEFANRAGVRGGQDGGDRRHLANVDGDAADRGYASRCAGTGAPPGRCAGSGHA